MCPRARCCWLWPAVTCLFACGLSCPRLHAPRLCRKAPHLPPGHACAEQPRLRPVVLPADSENLTCAPAPPRIYVPLPAEENAHPLFGVEGPGAPMDEEPTKLGAGLDFFGTNEGLITRRDSGDSSEYGFSSDDSEGEDDGDAAGGQHDAHGYELRIDKLRGRQAAAKVDEYASYIAQLEDEILNLKEKNYILQQEVDESRRREQEQLQQHPDDDSVGAREGEGAAEHSQSEAEEADGGNG